MDDGLTTLDLNWLDPLLAAMPERAKRRKSIFDIARVGDSELAVSNVIAFYLDKNEEHGLHDLFFRSLMDLYLAKTVQTGDKWEESLRDAVDYSVSREWYIGGAERKFLDIVITGRTARAKGKPLLDEEPTSVRHPWAVLIENKVHAGPYNKLHVYEQAVEAELKALIYLGLRDPGPIRHGWYFISHAELIARVRDKLPRYFDGADDRHLILLKDHFYNLERHNMTADDQTLMSQLMALHQKRAEIGKLDKLRDELAQHWASVLDLYMKEKGFTVAQKEGYTDHRSYWPDLEHFRLSSEMDKCVKIYVPMWELLDDAVFKATFELNQHTNTAHGEGVRTALKLETLPTGLKRGNAGREGGTFYHLLLVEKRMQSADTLQSAVRLILDSTLFKDGSNLIKRTFDELMKRRKVGTARL